jgi:hypothetical protein
VEENTMKKMLTLTTAFIASGIAIITMAQGVRSISFTSREAMEAYYEEKRHELQVMGENFEKGRTDDAALKEAIVRLFTHVMIFENHERAKLNLRVAEEMHKRGISQERQIQGWEYIIREMLSDTKELELVEKELRVSLIGTYLAMLGSYPGYDLQPIFEECLNSPYERIRTLAQRGYDFAMKQAQAQPMPSDNEEASSTPPTPPDSPHSEPTPPVLTNEVAQSILATPPEQPEKSSSNKPLLWVAIVALLALLGGVIAWRRTP